MMKYFSSFNFDDDTATLARGGRAVPLTRKAGELLRCLIDHAGSSVPHTTILSTVWPDTHVQPDNVKVLVRELRRALGDDARQPRFIRNIPAQGYAFIAAADHAPGPVDRPELARPVMFVDRQDERTVLAKAVDLGTGAPPRIVVVEGERGIGKTALCDEFIRTVGRRRDVRVARGQCIDQIVSSHPYFPVVGALNQLARQCPDVLTTLDRHAPAWLALLRESATALTNAPREACPAPEAMARELSSLFAERSTHVTAVLILEDLQWTDTGTLELLRALLRQDDRCGLVILATCSTGRQTPAMPLLGRVRADLGDRPGCATLRLPRLTAGGVRRYLALRFESESFDRLARPLHATTQGHPGCLVAALDALTTAGHLHETAAGWQLDLPARLLEPVLAAAVLPALSSVFERMDDEDRALLQAAAAVGVDFSLNDCGCALEAGDLSTVGERLDRLVERGFVVRATRPDESQTGYRFPHACHAEAVLLGATPFQQLQVAERLAVGNARRSVRMS